MAVTLAHRFSVDDYFRMAETGILSPDARVELIEGEIIDMLPIGPFHSGALNQLVRDFSAQAEGRWLVSCQSPIHLNVSSLPEPDLMLLRPTTDHYKSAHPIPEDVYLVIEVSDSSLIFDRETKLPLYAKAGIEEAWILNVPQKQLEIYRQPNALGYESQTILTDGEAAPFRFPDAVIQVRELVN
ncbi:MAG: Uma2 family endonuclease [Verrucomicrobiae bacterium]|nr:Uma2 family endonuclease [Verrucomicrobiae bacterium]